MKRIINGDTWAGLGLAAVLLLGCDVDETDSEGQGVSSSDESDAESSDPEGSDVETEESDGSGSETDGTQETTDGGRDAGGADAGGGQDAAVDEAEPASGVRGFVVVHSDYQSSTISVIGLDGEVLSPLVLTSGSAPAGVSEALSSDIVLPSSATGGEHAVIVDRGNSVINWLNLNSAEVDFQLNVAPGGFDANPYDYALYEPGKAFVTRHGTNGDPGQEDFDQGDDVLIIDPDAGEIIGRIALVDVPDDDDLLPRPTAVTIVNDKLYVLAVAIDVDFASYGQSKLVVIDPASEEIDQVLAIDGMRNCGELAVSPTGDQLAIGCIGDWTGDPLDQSGIALVDLGAAEAELGDQYFAKEIGGFQVSTVSYASSNVLLWTATGSYDDDFNIVAGDSLRVVDLEAGEPQESALLETTVPYNLGGLKCVPSQRVCLLADAENAELQYITLGDTGAVEDIEAIEVDDGVGHPPRYIGLW